jgi:hypothetical protein
MPGLMTVVSERLSWQPPHTRASPARAENQIGSFSSDMPNTSTACRWSGTFAGTVASQLPSDATRATPRFAWPSNIVVPNISGKPSSDEKPSMMRTP